MVAYLEDLAQLPYIDTSRVVLVKGEKRIPAPGRCIMEGSDMVEYPLAREEEINKKLESSLP